MGAGCEGARIPAAAADRLISERPRSLLGAGIDSLSGGGSGGDGGGCCCCCCCCCCSDGDVLSLDPDVSFERKDLVLDLSLLIFVGRVAVPAAAVASAVAEDEDDADGEGGASSIPLMLLLLLLLPLLRGAVAAVCSLSPPLERLAIVGGFLLLASLLLSANRVCSTVSSSSFNQRFSLVGFLSTPFFFNCCCCC